MGETVEFQSNGNTASGYLTTPEEGAGPGIVVIQEWWGLDSGIKTVCDKLAAEGFTALAPDLYHGELAQHTEMDKAGQLMSSLPPDRAARDMGGAVDFLAGHDAVRGGQVGVLGFCMGGMLAFHLACIRPEKVGAVVAYYGAPLDPNMEPDLSKLDAPVQMHLAEKDDFFQLDPMTAFEGKLKDLGKDIESFMYPGTGHAFAAEHDALGTHNEDAARQAWVRTLEFLRSKLG